MLGSAQWAVFFAACAGSTTAVTQSYAVAEAGCYSTLIELISTVSLTHVCYTFTHDYTTEYTHVPKISSVT